MFQTNEKTIFAFSHFGTHLVLLKFTEFLRKRNEMKIEKETDRFNISNILPPGTQNTNKFSGKAIKTGLQYISHPAQNIKILNRKISFLLMKTQESSPNHCILAKYFSNHFAFIMMAF